MKMRCPYCQTSAEWPRSGECPSCGKVSLAKGFFARSGKVKKEGRRRERDVMPTQPWLMSGRIMGVFLIWTKIPRWLIWICGLAIIGAAIYAPKMKVDFPELRKAAAESLATLHVALDMFKEDCGRYPSSKEGLGALVVKPEDVQGWRGPYIRKLKKDPWSKPYVYRCEDGRSLKLFSSGPDGSEGGGDDVFAALRAPEAEGPREVEVILGGRPKPAATNDSAEKLENPVAP